MAVQWHIQLLGGLQAHRGDVIQTHFETRKAATLLAYLAFYPQRSHQREALAEQLWPEEEPEVVRDRFRQALSALRRALEQPDLPAGSVLITDRSEVRLHPQSVTTDVTQFQTMLRRASQSDTDAERLSLLQQACALYQGELLPGHYEDWVLAERERLAESYRKSLLQMARTLMEMGDESAAIDSARRAVEIDPLQEEAHAELMRLYARAGRKADAVRQYRELERVLREEIGSTPSSALRGMLADLHSAESAPPQKAPAPIAAVHVAPNPNIEPEGGAVPLDSNFYIERPTDEAFAEAIGREDSIVLVKGARHVGKTSLLARGLQSAREAGAKVVLTDLQKVTGSQMEEADALFYTIAETMAEALELEIDLDKFWKPQRGWNVNFDRFLRREVLTNLQSHLVWGLDEVDRLFAYPYSGDVFGLFRSWHNERSLDPTGPWGKLTLAMAYATEVHLFIADLNQSPFNVGTRLVLEDFTRGEVAEINRRYLSPLRTEADLDQFNALVGGNPYLVRRGLSALMSQKIDMAAFEAQADRDDGIFGDSLHRMLSALRQDGALCDAVMALLHGQPCPCSESFYRLKSAGVVIGASTRDARFRCKLYHRYLEKHLL